MAGKAGPRWIQLPPEEPVSAFVLVGGQKVTQADDEGRGYKSIDDYIPDADPNSDCVFPLLSCLLWALCTCACVSMLHPVFNTTWASCQGPSVLWLTPCCLLPGWICCSLPLVSLLSYNITGMLNLLPAGPVSTVMRYRGWSLVYFQMGRMKDLKVRHLLRDARNEAGAQTHTQTHAHTSFNPKNIHFTVLSLPPYSTSLFLSLFLLSPHCSSISADLPGQPYPQTIARPRSFTSGRSEGKGCKGEGCILLKTHTSTFRSIPASPHCHQCLFTEDCWYPPQLSSSLRQASDMLDGKL